VPNGTGVTVTLYDLSYNVIANPQTDILPGTQFYFNSTGIPPSGSFINWTDQYSNVLGTSAFYGPYTMPAEDMIMTANWTSGSKDFIAKGAKANLYASLTIAGGGRLTVETLFNDNENGEEAIIVQSPAFDPLNPPSPLPPDGSLINYNTGVPATVERYITSERWHYVSPPISDAVSGVFLDIYLKYWDEVTGKFNYIVPVDTVLSPMYGFGTWASDILTGTKTVDWAGTLNTGITTNTTLTNTTGTSSTGYNFVGNPFPSAIDWDVTQGWTKTNLDNAIYIWNPAVGQYGSYVGGSVVNGVTNIIPSGQAFFVHVSNGSATGSITVNNIARLHDNKPFFKGTTTNNELIKLNILSDINTYSDEVIVRFNESATENFDPDFDAYDILAGLEEAPSIYTVSNDNSNLSINSLKTTDNDITVPVMVEVGIDGIYSIEAVQLSNIEDKYIYLKDLKEDIITELTEQTVYSFYSSINDDPARFEILFKSSPLSIGSLDIAGNIRIYSDRNVVYLVSNGDPFSGILNIYDMGGKMVYSDDLKGLSKYEATLNVEKGFYIVKMFTGDKVITGKVLVFN
jgi:hypothetical protein